MGFGFVVQIPQVKSRASGVGGATALFGFAASSPPGKPRKLWFVRHSLAL
jgi:hypothetical protein